MQITVNGEAREVKAELTVEELLLQLGIKAERVAVEVNLEVVRRERRGERRLAPGDAVEIVSFVGGGAGW